MKNQRLVWRCVAKPSCSGRLVPPQWSASSLGSAVTSSFYFHSSFPSLFLSFSFFPTSMGPQRFVGLVQQPQLLPVLSDMLVFFSSFFIASARTCMFRCQILPRRTVAATRWPRRIGNWSCAQLCSDPVNEITKSLNNASVRPIPSFEGKFEAITLAPRRLIL